MEGKIDASDFYLLQKDHFHALNNNTLIPNDLDTGDIILFSRRCADMNLFGAMLCYGAKQYSPWDHICVIVKEPSTGKLFALEAALEGIKLFEVDDRINHSKAPAIAIRYLRITRTDKQRQDIWNLVKEMEGKPYTTDTNTLMKAGFWSPQKFKRVILQNREHFLQQRLQEIQVCIPLSVRQKNTMRTSTMDPFTSDLLIVSQKSVSDELIEVSELVQTERRSRLENDEVNHEFFCSQTVATVLKAMEILPAAVPATEYLPYSFSSEVGLPLLRGASFSGEMFIRGAKKDVFCNMALKTAAAEKEKEEKGDEVVSDQDDGATTAEEKETLRSRLSVLSVLSEEDQQYVLTQLRLSRPFGRSSNLSLQQLLSAMQVSFYIPGDVIPLGYAEMVLCVLLRGDVRFNQWSDALGETVLETRGPLSLLGVAAHPSDGQSLVRITDADVAALGCASGQEVMKRVKEAPGIHKAERARLIHCMRSHPAFQHLSFVDLYRLSYFFYKVTLHAGDMVSREGCYQNYICFVDNGSVRRHEKTKRGWTESNTDMMHGTFPGATSVLNNRPSDATYVVAADDTQLYVVNPTVVAYFLGGRFTEAPSLLQQIRDPTASTVLSALKEAVDGIRFYKTGDSVEIMRGGFQALKGMKEDPLVLDEMMSKRVQALVQLLKIVYHDAEIENDTHSHKDGINQVMATSVDLLQQLNLPSVINTVYSTIYGLLYPSETKEDETSLIDEKAVTASLDSFKRHNDINDFTDEQVLGVLQALQYDNPISTAQYLMFLSFCGVSEDCSLSYQRFIIKAEEIGMMTDTNKAEMIDFFFGTSEKSLSFAEFKEKLSLSAVPTPIRSYVDEMTSLVAEIVPNQMAAGEKQKQIIHTYRTEDREATLHLHSPFHLIPLPFPVPYALTFAMRHDTPSVDYWKYVAGGFAGELFGRFILYPTYLSSYTHLMMKDVRPLSLLRVFFGDREFMKRPGIPPAPKPTAVPAVVKLTPADVTLRAVKPIVISDTHSKAARGIKEAIPVTKSLHVDTTMTAVKRPLNTIVGGFGRYVWLLLLERSVQLTCFPFILRSVRDHSFTNDWPLSLQTVVAGGAVGAVITFIRHPFDRKYMQKILAIPQNRSISLWKRLYGGFLPSLIHSSLFNSIFFGTFIYFWEANNRDYISDHGLPRVLPHQREVLLEERPPVHYELLGKSILVATCAYTAAQLICYPIGVYKNMKMLRSFDTPSLSPLYEQASSIKVFFSKANRAALYGGMWTRVAWSVLGCSMGIAFGSALLTKNYRDNLKK